LQNRGGAAGNDVVSEGQGYALLASGITLASMKPNDPNRNSAISIFFGFFNGWKKMAQLSSSNPGNCQPTKFCDAQVDETLKCSIHSLREEICCLSFHSI